MAEPPRITALQTGTVAVKESHRRLRGPAVLRLPAIVADPRWTPPLPIHAWLIEHSEGRILVDTGESSRTGDKGYFDDPVSPRILRLDVEPEDELGPDLRPDRVVLTHAHTDHTGGIGAFPEAEFLIGRRDLERPPGGSVPSSWPKGWDPTPIEFGDGPLGPFESSHLLIRDGAVRIVPTPGHTHGHVSVVVDRGDDLVMLAGDASFTDEQVARRQLAGIVRDIDAAGETLRRIADLARQRPLVYLPSHDPRSAERLSAGTRFEPDA